MNESFLITMKDARAAGICSKGVRDFFQRSGLDYSEFLKNGLPVEEIEATGDLIALRVTKVARDGR